MGVNVEEHTATGELESAVLLEDVGLVTLVAAPHRNGSFAHGHNGPTLLVNHTEFGPEHGDFGVRGENAEGSLPLRNSERGAAGEELEFEAILTRLDEPPLGALSPASDRTVLEGEPRLAAGGKTESLVGSPVEGPLADEVLLSPVDRSDDPCAEVDGDPRRCSGVLRAESDEENERQDRGRRESGGPAGGDQSIDSHRRRRRLHRARREILAEEFIELAGDPGEGGLDQRDIVEESLPRRPTIGARVEVTFEQALLARRNLLVDRSREPSVREFARDFGSHRSLQIPGRGGPLPSFVRQFCIIGENPRPIDPHFRPLGSAAAEPETAGIPPL